MKKSTNHRWDSLGECLHHIQLHLDAPKTQHNSFGNYSYRTIDDIFEALKPLLRETGCFITCTDSVEDVGGRHYVKSMVTIHKGDEKISSVGFARESDGKKGMDDAQLTGTCSTYSRKVALGGLFIIDDNRDVDSMDNTYTITDEQKSEYQSLLKHKLFNGTRHETNRWWKNFTTIEQAESGLQVMRKRVDDHNKKNGTLEMEVVDGNS